MNNDDNDNGDDNGNIYNDNDDNFRLNCPNVCCP